LKKREELRINSKDKKNIKSISKDKTVQEEAEKDNQTKMKLIQADKD
jgi:hypothetical protein